MPVARYAAPPVQASLLVNTQTTMGSPSILVGHRAKPTGAKVATTAISPPNMSGIYGPLKSPSQKRCGMQVIKPSLPESGTWAAKAHGQPIVDLIQVALHVVFLRLTKILTLNQARMENPLPSGSGRKRQTSLNHKKIQSN